MNEKLIGEICFYTGVVLLFFFLRKHYRRKKPDCFKILEKISSGKSSVFDEGSFAFLHFLRKRNPFLKKIFKKEVFCIKRERMERLRKIYVGEEEETIYYRHYGRLVKQLAGVFITGLFLVSASVFIRQEQVLIREYFLLRDEAGGSTKKYSIKAESGKEEKKLTVRLPNRKYSKEEEKRALGEVKKRLEHVVLGENKSPEKIQSPLRFVAFFPEFQTSVRWKIPGDSPVSSDGTLKNEELEEPVQTGIKAVLSCGESEEIWTEAFIIYPPLKKKELSFWEKWQKKYDENEKESETKEYVELPREIDGKQIRYSEEQISYPYIVLVGVFVLCLLLPVLSESRLKEKIKKRQEQLSLDYPEFIEHFVLLVGAGLTVKGAWERIVLEYEKRKKKKELHFVYEEMAVTVREIENGLSEAQAYELFGKRTELLPYMKFCTLLVQNLRKGSSDLLKLLEYEMTDSFQARKDNAKALGEKAGTKLLMPMAVMLVIVFVLILYAAFQNM